MTTAGPEDSIESWMASPLCGRYCGSLYVTALLEAWSEESKAAEIDNTQPASSNAPAQEHSYASFTESVHDIFFKVGKFASTHNVQFSAQDVSRLNFQEKWNSLPSVPAKADPKAFSNRAPGSASGTMGNDTRTGSLSSRFSSEVEAAEHVKMVAQLYLQSGPGRDSLAPNTGLHDALNRLIENRMTLTFWGLEGIYCQLQYRTELMGVATQMLQRIGVPLPLSQTCSRFDNEAFDDFVRKKSRPRHEQKGHPWNKPHRYIAAALAHWNAMSTPGDIDTIILKLEGVHAENVAMLKQALDKSDEVRSRKRKFFSDLGKRLRSISPEKRTKRSSRRGESSGGS
ncbi:hypothetical protein DE146DRAFT_763339 [Phaeosphaeria sp. MPI-PUGE-AT-0046c]|nr:hypothetical protein DE146DRAFT_763339 [Phaeosphaeria sp. MPI-PUGE-AT-0046c]